MLLLPVCAAAGTIECLYGKEGNTACESSATIFNFYYCKMEL